MHKYNWNDNHISFALAGHSTVLINMYGKWIITDPLLFEKLGVLIGKWKVGIKRITPAAFRVEEIPQLDYVLLSHAHMDHWDKQTLRELFKRFPDQLHVICPRNTKHLLKSYKGVKSVTEVERGEDVVVDGLHIRAGETDHWWAIWPWERYRSYTKWHHKAKGHNSYLISYQWKNIVFGGDTAYTEAYRELTDRADVAIMPIGSYDPWIDNHCNPEQAVTMAEHMNAKWFIPVHFETFRLDKAHFHEPRERLKKALDKHSSIRLALENIGDQFVLE